MPGWPALQATVVDKDYQAKKYKDTGNTIEEGGTERRSYSNKGATCKKLVQDDEGFWVRVKKHAHATLPIFKFLRRVDTGAPTLGKLYSGWFELGEFLKSSDSDFKEVAIDKWDERWAYGHRPIAAAAYVVDPEFHAHKQESNEEVMTHFMETLEKIAILVAVRSSSDKLTQAWQQRRELIAADKTAWKVYTHYPTYPTPSTPVVKTFCATVCAQLNLYRSRKGLFARDWIFEAAEKMPAHEWWDSYGASVPELQAFAMLVLCQPSSASICERINSEFAFVKDPRRNRLKHGKANKLVALFHNLRLLFRMKKPNYIEPAVGWNYEDQKTGLVKYGLTHWEPAEVKTIPAPVRPPVAFADEDADGYDPRDAEFLSQDPLEDMDCVAGLLE